MFGTRVSHYNVIRSLGSGGMGVVYGAEDTRLGRSMWPQRGPQTERR